MTSTESPLVGPFREESILKENRYKKVCLMMDASNQRFISKTYQGREKQHSRSNAEYAFEILHFFHSNFSKHTTIPKVFELDNESVYLEYLPQLPGAQLLDSDSIPSARNFFEHCYNFRLMEKPFRSIEQSVYFTEGMQHWLEAEKPIALGLKGDLWQNLCRTDDGLILADIDSAAIEPLGFSEVVMHAEIHAGLTKQNLRNKLFHSPCRPVCFETLSQNDSLALIELALHFVSLRMAHLPSILRKAKIFIAKRALSASLVA